jgi:hypothetical protein
MFVYKSGLRREPGHQRGGKRVGSRHGKIDGLFSSSRRVFATLEGIATSSQSMGEIQVPCTKKRWGNGGDGGSQRGV